MKVYEVSYINQYGYKVITKHYSASWAEFRRKEILKSHKASSEIIEYEQCVLDT